MPPQHLEAWALTGQLLEVRGGEPGKAGVPFLGELESHHSLILAIDDSTDETRTLGPVRQLDSTVVAQQQVSGDVAY